MKIFNADDIIQFAIRVEEDGETLYRKVAETVKDKDVRELFLFLAGQEVTHKAVFQQMLSGIETLPPAETYDGEYVSYLNDYIDGKVIFTDKVKGEAISTGKDTLSAITFALKREADSILYYQEAKRFIAQKYHNAVDKIIDEERKHFVKLSELRKKYT
ncbi:MAG TPA: ferritin family protein [Syntrophorhabdaceae bacterium]|nr:ferritin family protein [Syntrophorhabdaceae bacterium]